jgi:hypothetical protein
MAKSLATARWHELDTKVHSALRWLNATALLTTDDLCQVIWPEPVSRRNIGLCLQRWTEAGLILPVDAGRLYQLGSTGAAKLRDGGYVVDGPTQELSARVRPGLLLASRFAVGLWRDLCGEPAIGGMRWWAQPFSGSGARPDAVGLLLHTYDRSRCDRLGADILVDAVPDPPQLRGTQVLTQIVLEIDSGAETLAQLRDRARARHARIAQLAPLPENTMLLPVCVTSGGWDRAGTIWQAWVAEARCPLWVTTEVALRTADGDLRPWHGTRGDAQGRRYVWRDEHGRPRSLNPWELQEPRWRYENAGPPTVTSLAEAIRAWDTRS